MMEHNTNQAVSDAGIGDGGVIATVATLVAGLLASGKSGIGIGRHGNNPLAGAVLEDVVDTAVAIHLAAGKPFAELKAGYDKRNAEHKAWQDGDGWSLGIPADVWDEVRHDYDTDYSKLDRDAMRKLGELDRYYRAQRGDIYRQLTGGAVEVGVKLPALDALGKSAD